MTRFSTAETNPESGALALVFADTPGSAAPAVAALNAMGLRVAPHLPIAEIADRLTQQSEVGQLVIVLDDQADHDLDWAIRTAEHFAEELSCPLTIDFPARLVDPVIAASNRNETLLLCAADPVDRITAMATAMGPASHMLHDKAVDIDSLRLKRLADEVQRIARALNGLTASGERADYQPATTPSLAMHDAAPAFSAQPADLFKPDPPDASEIRTVIRLRRLRDTLFESELFADPAWDMLLDLFAAGIEGDQVAVSSLCIAAAVPPTTALRWIKTMTDAGLFERHADPLDGRRVFIRLTDRATDGMTRYFASARRIGGFLV